MSRIGNRQLAIPEGVTVTVNGQEVTVNGKLGNLSLNVNKNISVEIVDNKVIVKRANETKQVKQLHGTTNALINNMIIGVSEGFQKELEINGVGYKAQTQGNDVVLNVGYSHPVKLSIPEGVKVECPSATEVKVSGYNKQVVTEFAAKIREVRLPEPYKGKGIKYKDEVIRRKEGKKAA